MAKVSCIIMLSFHAAYSLIVGIAFDSEVLFSACNKVLTVLNVPLKQVSIHIYVLYLVYTSLFNLCLSLPGENAHVLPAAHHQKFWTQGLQAATFSSFAKSK